ncbi:hypothetical protein GCM10007301_28400 [Azorhizobium oxalatiphilum]|uniref:Uncharacterized protein n=1 Tax=Azorhizobium oxalatiphilum TaxID=980631 RepID=A0A917FCU4_9HYPH|nr:hypothetical protein [Azorhizobium oxalatiphilum]GGF67069.1 hypothetical protein GCM10007301_28400 [Azorhizobium oxalatiphilum]
MDQLDPVVVQRETEAALAAKDADLAASWLAVAEARRILLPDDLTTRVRAAEAAAHSTYAQMRSFGAGFLTGQPEDLPGFAGAALGDFMVWGDIRDASREGWNLARGEEADELILGLSTVGLALTAGTYATVGGGAPVKAGVSLVKAARRGGRLSAAMGATLTRAVRESVDFAALRRVPDRIAALDGAALKSVVRTDKVRDLGRLLADAGTIEAKAGTKATMEGLRIADGSADMGRMARLAEAKGPQTLALLKSFGRGAFAITGAFLSLIWWGMGATLWLLGAIWTFNALVVALLRPLWRRKRRRRVAVGRLTAVHSG